MLGYRVVTDGHAQEAIAATKPSCYVHCYISSWEGLQPALQNPFTLPGYVHTEDPSAHSEGNYTVCVLFFQYFRHNCKSFKYNPLFRHIVKPQLYALWLYANSDIIRCIIGPEIQANLFQHPHYIFFKFKRNSINWTQI